MNNHANEPAFPAQGTQPGRYLGLSKRELAAIIIMAGRCANGRLADPADAVYWADKLFQELEKP